MGCAPRVPLPAASTVGSSQCPACAAAPHALPPSRLPARMSPLCPCACLSTRQGTSAFNQPLSFDTSSVTNMGGMFYVRSARALASSLHSRVLPVPCLRRRPHTPSRLPGPHLAPLPMLPVRLGRVHKGCPQPTSFSPVAHGRAPRPSRLLTMARAGVRGTAPRPHPPPHNRRRRRRRPTPSRTRPP